MKGLIKASEEAGSLKLVELPKPQAGPGEVVVRVKATGICYTDVSILKNTYKGRKPVPVPIVMGHEGAGIVAEIGPGVTKVRSGDRVGFEALWGCGKCRQCVSGQSNMCLDWGHIGITCNGTFAEYVTVKEKMVHLLPDTVSFIDAAFLEPMSLVVRTLEYVRPMVGETAVIIGPGALGLYHLQALKAAGMSRVFMVGIGKDRKRFAVAEKLGADSIIDADKEDPVQSVIAATGGEGADIVVETASSPKVYGIIPDLAAPRGRVALFGLYPQAEISPVKILRKGLSLFGDVGLIPRQFQRAVSWTASGKVLTSNMITRTFTLEQGEAAFQAQMNGDEVKVVFEIS
jgi:threonine dehydrogenase-like Zn-dependent dehydrogenase